MQWNTNILIDFFRRFIIYQFQKANLYTQTIGILSQSNNRGMSTSITFPVCQKPSSNRLLKQSITSCEKDGWIYTHTLPFRVLFILFRKRKSWGFQHAVFLRIPFYAKNLCFYSHVTTGEERFFSKLSNNLSNFMVFPQQFESLQVSFRVLKPTFSKFV